MSVRHARKESKTTPPGSFTKAPLTPPPSEQKSGTSVERIIQEIKSRRSSRSFSTNPWLRYKLSPAEYIDVEQRLQRDNFVEDKSEVLLQHSDGWSTAQFTDIPRFDYFQSARLFVLRMPSVLHEEFKSSIVDDIVQQLHSIAKERGPASEFARRIKHGGSAAITFSDPAYGRHEPDNLFRYLQAQFPNVIFELSYSQKRRDLARLADNYILGSDGNIRVMVGMNFVVGSRLDGSVRQQSFSVTRIDATVFAHAERRLRRFSRRKTD